MTGPTAAPDDESGTVIRETDPTPQAGNELASTSELGPAVAAITAEDIEPAQRRRLLGRIAAAVRERGTGALYRPKAALRWMVDAIADVAPHVPVRDIETLRIHHDGVDGEELAERLVRNAARATTAVGAAGGGVAAVEWVVTPTLLSAPVLLAVETIAVVAIEMKLIGELHEVYRVPVRGNGPQRAVALIQSWAVQRGINPMLPGIGAAAVLSTAARKELRDRLLRRFGRNLTTLGPFLAGAAVAGYLNRRATLAIGDRIRADLRRRGRRELPGGSG